MQSQNNADLFDQQDDKADADDFGVGLLAQMQLLQETQQARSAPEMSQANLAITAEADEEGEVDVVEPPEAQEEPAIADDGVLPDDAFLSEEESAQRISEHNDALDGVSAPDKQPSETTAPEAEGLGGGDQDAEASLVNEPFLGFASARELLAKGRSLDTAFAAGLRKPPVGDSDQQDDDQAQSNTVDMNAATAALMLGGIGLMKLGKTMGKGIGSVGAGISLWKSHKAEKEMNESISLLSSGLDNLRHKGLVQLDDESLPVGERQNMAKQFFSHPGNEVLLEQLFADADRVKAKARVLMEKSIKNDSSADAVADRVLEPLRRLTEKNEHMMDSLKLGDETLLERMDNAMNGLFDSLKAMFKAIAGKLGFGGGNKPESSGSKLAPTMG